MAPIQFQCPRCRAGFSIKNATPAAVARQTFRCPKCGHTAPLSQILGGASSPGAHPATQIGGIPGSPKTQIGGAPGIVGGMPGTPKTQIAGAMAGGAKTQIAGGAGAPVVTLTVMPSGRRIPLPQGVYTLGRDSSDSRASLRIAPDPYMSRLQARLEVMTSQVGPVCRIIGLSPTNPVMINNRPTNQNFGVDLRNGDTLLLGMTRVVVNF